MNSKQHVTETLLTRTNLNLDFKKYLRNVNDFYSNLGKFTNYSPINEGYEDANFLLISVSGKYVLKVFSKGRSLNNINDYIRVLIESDNNKIPVTRLIAGKKGEYLFSMGAVHCILTKYFEGYDFKEITPDIHDIIKVAGYLARINSLNIKVEESYDSWGNKNLIREYYANKTKITSDQKTLIEPVVEELSKVDFTNFKKALIHGDMQRKHVLKNKKGEYCILDFGCMAYDPIVIDISTYLAWFCLQKDTRGNAKQICGSVLGEYGKLHNFSKDEIQSIPSLVKASYAAYYLKTSVLISEGDRSVETEEWSELSREMLLLSKKLF